MLKTLSLLVIFAVSTASSSFAFETDQYDLPPTPLADIGDEVSDHTIETLREILAKVNAEISIRRACIDGTQTDKKVCRQLETDKKRLEYLLSDDAIARELYKKLGDGKFPFTKVGNWLNTNKFAAEPSRYKTSYSKSIFILLPTNYLTISPTINMYGSQFGVDKIEHIFQQGYTYYNMEREDVAKGMSSEDAIKKAVKWGKVSERTFFGSLVSGTFSNADLVANYVGMKFYQGLFEEIKIGNVSRPAILLRENGVWVLNETGDLRDRILRPFISDHLNEAWNPSIFSFNLRFSIRRIVKKRACQQWIKAFPDLTKADSESRSAALTLWNGEDYGYTASRKFITIANTCDLEKPKTN